MELVNLVGEKVEVKECLGCEIVKVKLDAFGGILYNGEYFTLTQDFELPINGFLIITSKRHITKYIELTQMERLELQDIIFKALKILEENNIAEEYNVILEEKAYHFHVWLMPRHKWMIDKFGKVLKNIKPIQEFAIKYMKTKENIELIKNTCELIKREMN